MRCELWISILGDGNGHAWTETKKSLSPVIPHSHIIILGWHNLKGRKYFLMTIFLNDDVFSGLQCKSCLPQLEWAILEGKSTWQFRVCLVCPVCKSSYGTFVTHCWMRTQVLREVGYCSSTLSSSSLPRLRIWSHFPPLWNEAWPNDLLYPMKC
jgi:hypothetical protein